MLSLVIYWKLLEGFPEGQEKFCKVGQSYETLQKLSILVLWVIEQFIALREAHDIGVMFDNKVFI